MGAELQINSRNYGKRPENGLKTGGKYGRKIRAEKRTENTGGKNGRKITDKIEHYNIKNTTCICGLNINLWENCIDI